MIMYAGSVAGAKTMVENGYYSDALFFTYWIRQFIPFLVPLSIPEWRRKLRRLLLVGRRQRAVAPQILAMIYPRAGRPRVLQQARHVVRFYQFVSTNRCDVLVDRFLLRWHLSKQ